MDTIRWWLALGIWVIGSVWVHLFYIKRIRLSEEPVLAPIRIIDGTALRVQLPGGLFKHAEGRIDLSSRWSISFRSGLDSLADYLKAHPRRLLTITGYYTPAESRSTLISNLGMVRAQGIQHYLMNAGAPEDQLQIRGQVSDALSFVRDSTNALSFTFESVRIDAEWLAQRQKYIDLFHPMQLYFPTGSTEYIHTPDNERFASEAIAYLRIHPQERLVLTGHTDSVGTESRNLRLSRLRALTVRNRLVQKGIPKRRFRIVAQGNKMPIVSNTTVEGRDANRRVTMLVINHI